MWSSATQHAMPPEFGRKWGMERLNTRFPLSTLLFFTLMYIFVYISMFVTRLSLKSKIYLTGIN